MSAHEGINPRQFRSSDLAQLRRLIRRTIDTRYRGVYPPRAVRFFRDFHGDREILHRSENGHVVVVEANGALVGTGALVGEEILGVFVAPEVQGRGYGRAIMLELERMAKAKGITEITLSVSLPSKRFYEGLGYELVEQCSLDVGRGQRLDYWKARKRLDPARS